MKRKQKRILNQLGFESLELGLWSKVFVPKKELLKTLDFFLKNEKGAIDKCFKKKDSKINLKEKDSF